MTDITEDDLKHARNVVENLIKNGEQKGLLTELKDGLSVVDIQENAEQFIAEMYLLKRLGIDFPALPFGDNHPVPITLTEFIPYWSPTLVRTITFQHDFDLFWKRFFRQLIQRGLARFGKAVEELRLSDAKESFVTHASKFLASRIAGHRMLATDGPLGQPPPELNMLKFFGGPRTNVPGCHFSVHTNSPGLSTYWSGAYYISPNYHGAPTTPAKGVLQAGTYVFGINGGAYGSTVQWDTNAVCTLPGTPSVHLQF